MTIMAQRDFVRRLLHRVEDNILHYLNRQHREMSSRELHLLIRTGIDEEITGGAPQPGEMWSIAPDDDKVVILSVDPMSARVIYLFKGRAWWEDTSVVDFPVGLSPHIARIPLSMLRERSWL
jgi:hypothetical protein